MSGWQLDRPTAAASLRVVSGPLMHLPFCCCRRKYADMSSKPKYRFQHLQMDPYVSLSV